MMIRTLNALVLILTLSLFTSFVASTQNVILNIDTNLSIPGDCQTITEGTSITFERGLGMFQCDPEVIIQRDGESIPVFATNDLIFTYDFSEPGEYVIFCGNTLVTSTRVATTAACFTVLSSVPTMGEWGVIILGLLLIIVACVVLLPSKAVQRI